MDELDRMFRQLVQNIRAQDPDALHQPLTVGELYQTVIPYRHNRRALGIETNQEYELALMRLLAGERGYLDAGQQVQDEMQRELGSPNPDTSAFRAFADEQVRIAPDALRQFGQSSGAPTAPALDDVRLGTRSAPSPRAESVGASGGSTARSAGGGASAGIQSATYAARDEASSASAQRAPMPGHRAEVEAGVAPAPSSAGRTAPRETGSGTGGQSRPQARAAGGGMQMPGGAGRGAQQAPGSVPQPTTTAAALGGGCPYCSAPLPDGRRLTFCPHCGQNLTIQHCPACSTELELGWKFCTTCGRSVAGS